MKLLLDMNIAPRWARFLAEAGIQAVHWSSVGSADAPDSEIMAYARANDCVILTQDLDFTALLAITQGRKPSVAQIRADDTSPETIGRDVVMALRQAKKELADVYWFRLDLTVGSVLRCRCPIS
jgi:predicted nuclease of predicted toxin-antitoxin system